MVVVSSCCYVIVHSTINGPVIMPVIQDMLCIGRLGIIEFYISHMLLVFLSEIVADLSESCHFTCFTCKFVYTALF